MDEPFKSSSSSSSVAESTITTFVESIDAADINASDNNTRNPLIQNSLRSLNRSSYKISKPPSRNPNSGLNPNPSPQSQPPVYNIDKSNFREVVQKLTGSPSHRHPPPPPLPVAVSRLHRIRPPPLSNVSNAAVGGPAPSLSPLPPLPSVSAAVESPITAYMRRLRGGTSPTAVVTATAGFGCLGPATMPASPRLPLQSPRGNNQQTAKVNFSKVSSKDSILLLLLHDHIQNAQDIIRLCSVFLFLVSAIPAMIKKDDN